MHLVEEKVFAHIMNTEKDSRRWVLNTGSINHMSNTRLTFSELDSNGCGTVKFGDGFVVQIEGVGTMLFSCKNSEHQVFTSVYYIPKLTTNIISLGQLEEAGYQMIMEVGVMKVHDIEHRLLAKVPCAPTVSTWSTSPLHNRCSTRQGREGGAESACLWHVCFEHLIFLVLRKLAREGARPVGD